MRDAPPHLINRRGFLLSLRRLARRFKPFQPFVQFFAGAEKFPFAIDGTILVNLRYHWRDWDNHHAIRNVLAMVDFDEHGVGVDLLDDLARMRVFLAHVKKEFADETHRALHVLDG